ncbi:MAG: hypothetical protein RIR96_553 [Bacteroidota bacterium]|jgi:hypothetical protein
MHSITQEDLLLYLYGETSPQQTQEIKIALEQDWNLKEIYLQLEHTKNELDGFNMSPSENSVNKILKYAEIQVEELSTTE